jgi:hypothetical protein
MPKIKETREFSLRRPICVLLANGSIKKENGALKSH